MYDQSTAPVNFLNITEYCLAPGLTKSPEKTALILVDAPGQYQAFSFKEIYQSVCNLTVGLQSLQLSQGSVVVMQAPVNYDFFILFLAAIAAGLVPVVLLADQPDAETNFILNHSQAKAFFELGEKNIADLNLPNNCLHIKDKEFGSLMKFESSRLSTTTQYNDPAVIFYTSGSSGDPKGVLHAQHTVIGRAPSRQYWLNLNVNDVVMHTDNICWTYSMFVGFLDPLYAGATAIIYKPYSNHAEVTVPIDTTLQILKEHKVTLLASLPDVYHMILTSENLTQYPLPHLRSAVSAGEPLPDKTQEHWQTYFPFPIFSALGMTELSTFLSTGPTTPIRNNRIGKIQPGRKITILPLDEGFETVIPNTQGMLAIHESEPGLMIGYIGESKENNPAYRGQWFLTQDIVAMDDEGYIIYDGRADNILKVGSAFRVSPIEVEETLLDHDSINEAECSVYFDDKTLSNQLVAYIVVTNPSIALAQSIYQFVSARLIDYKVPYLLEFVTDLPRNVRGKVARNQISQANVLLTYSLLEFNLQHQKCNINS